VKLALAQLSFDPVFEEEAAAVENLPVIEQQEGGVGE